MLQNMNAMLLAAQRERRAIASINIYSPDSIRGALLAAEKREQPIILSFAARYQDNLSLELVVLMCTSFGRDVQIPYAIHLDHCSNLGLIDAALEAGFTSVMYDGSALPFEENMKNSALVAKKAHSRNASVQAELGAISTGIHASEDSGTQMLYTDPKEAATFVAETQIDALAVSIGTVHGMYRIAPNIRIDILQAIRSATDVPLVLHGGSGTRDDLLKETVLNGICKINVNTEISMFCVERLRGLINARNSIHLSELSLQTVLFFETAVGRYIDLFTRK